MKRQQNILQCFRKISRTEVSVDETCASQNKQQTLDRDITTQDADALKSNGSKTSEVSDLPECWSINQLKSFKQKYDGLIFRDKKLGCDYCGRFASTSVHTKGFHLSMEWANCRIVASGKNKEVQQASLRKKMNLHFSSQVHHVCVKQLKDCSNNMLKCIDNLNEKHMDSTIKVFNTVNSLAKRSCPFCDIEHEIELQIKNGVDMGVGLHSRKTAVKIVDHIATQIRKELFSKIIEKSLKTCIIIDEASTVSSKPVIVIFIKIKDCIISPMIFLDLVELGGQGAEEIYTCLLDSLHLVGFDEAYLKNHLIAFCSDGASVMLGRRSGVGIRLKNDFPNIILWHCLSHRLQLVLDDSVTDIKQVNHFKIFMDKIYTIFHQSNKNQMELFKISEELGQQIIKIDRVFGPRWSACSLRAALAVWRAYSALWKYFSNSTKHSGMANRLSNKYFLDDVALMIDILQELSFLSEALQGRCVTLTRAEKLILRSIKALELLIENKGTFEKKIVDRIASEEFKDIHLIENHKFGRLPWKKLLEVIIENMRKRLIDNGHLTSNNNDQEGMEFRQVINLLEPDTWNIQEVVVPWLVAEEKLYRFSDIFHYKISINDFRDYVESVLQNFKDPVIPQSVQKVKAIINTIAVSSAEAERGFSRMNHIYSDKRNRLTVENVANLMTISLVGLPFETWNANPFVKIWLRKNHSADDPRLKHKVVKEYDSNQVAIWNYLK